MKFLDNIKIIASLITGAGVIVSFIIGTYIGYSDVLNKIDKNMSQIEKTQMMILKKEVREYEHSKCSVSDAEWDEYIENYSLLYELKIKYKYISDKTPWKPVERISKDKENKSCEN